MKSKARLEVGLMALALMSMASAPAPGMSAGESGETRAALAVVGGDTLRVADLDVEISATLAAAKGRGEMPPLDPDAVVKRLIQDRLLEQEGLRMGADQAEAVQNQVLDWTRVQGVKGLMDSVSALPPGKAVENADSLLGRVNTMRRYAHILVADEATARSLKDSLSHGAGFADLARRHSTDNTAAQGGDLNWAAEGAYVEDFEKAARPLALHEIAGPVKTQFGWHLITLTGIKSDTLRSRSMAEGLSAARERARRTAAVRQYILSLRAKYGVTVNDTLLAGLDFASEDAKVVERLKTSEEVLAVLPTGRLTVKGFNRNIQFKYFHGLAGHADAAAIRDREFDEWITEALLSHESHELGFDKKPSVLEQADQIERRLIREEVLKSILSSMSAPDSEEIRSYYTAHLKDFTPAPKVKVRSVLLAEEQAAGKFREQLEGGATFTWLLSQVSGILDAPPPFPTDWVDAGVLGFGTQPIAQGTVLGPREFPGGWAVVQVTAVEEATPKPLSTCREDVLKAIRAGNARRAIEEAFARLEAATPVVIQKGAKEMVARRLETWRSESKEGKKP